MEINDLFSESYLKILLFGFMVGAIPWGILITPLFSNKNLREEGSGNIGATNVTRVAGKTAGKLVFLLDFLKGVLPTFYFSDQYGPVFGSMVGVFAVLGHCFSPWLFFRGGKGVATSAGVILVVMPHLFLIGAMVFFISWSMNRIVSIASLLSIFSVLFFNILFRHPRWQISVACFLFLLLVLRHRENLIRLLEEQEG